MKKKCNIGKNLADDVIFEILSYCTIEELIVISEVSKKWDFSKLSRDNRFWKRKYENVEKRMHPFVQNLRKKKIIEKIILKEKNYKRRIGLLFSFLLQNSPQTKIRCMRIFRKSFFHYNDSFNPLKITSMISKEIADGKYDWVLNGNFNEKKHKRIIIENTKPLNKRDKSIVEVNNSRKKKAIIIGTSGIGKTCFCIRLITNKFPDEYVPTVMDYADSEREKESILKRKEKIIWQLFDTGHGDYEKIRLESNIHYKCLSCVIIAFSCLNNDSFREIERRWLIEARVFAPGVPIILLETKIDLKKDKQILTEWKRMNKKLVEKTEIEELMKRNPDILFWVETSAFKGENIQLAFNLLDVCGAVYDEGFQHFLKIDKRKKKKKCTIQ